MIWIIGEYAERIDNADELLESFLDSFQDENTQVQLQLLTAIVKLFLKHPTDTQELVQQVLSLATQDSDNPDLRDRGTYALSFYRSQLPKCFGLVQIFCARPKIYLHIV